VRSYRRGDGSVTVTAFARMVFNIAGSGKTSCARALSMLGQSIIFRYVSGAWYIEHGSPTRGGIESAGTLLLQANAGASSSQPVKLYDGNVLHTAFTNAPGSQTNYAGARYVYGKNGNWSDGIDQANTTPYRDWFLIPVDASGAAYRSDLFMCMYPSDATEPGTINFGYRDDGSTTPVPDTASVVAVWGDGRNLGQDMLRLKYPASLTGALLRAVDGSSANELIQITAAGLLKCSAAGNEQTTVDSAGGASALPTTPTKYLKVVDSTGATLVVPAYAAS